MVRIPATDYPIDLQGFSRNIFGDARYDHVFLYQDSQKRMFDLLGTAAEKQRRVEKPAKRPLAILFFNSTASSLTRVKYKALNCVYIRIK